MSGPAKSYQVSNWTEMQSIEIELGGNHDRVPPIACIRMRASALSFNFGMTAPQAREAAAALTSIAELVEQAERATAQNLELLAKLRRAENKLARIGGAA